MFAEFVFCMLLNCFNFSFHKTLVQFSDVTAMTCALHRLTCEGQRKLRTRTCAVCVGYWNASPFPSDVIEHVTCIYVCTVAKRWFVACLWTALENLVHLSHNNKHKNSLWRWWCFCFLCVVNVLEESKKVEAQKSMVQSFSTSCFSGILFTR